MAETVRCYVSTAFACPYEGLVPLKSVIKVTESLFKMGVEEVSIGDTIGVAVPNEVEKMIKALSKINRLKKFAMHFHDTRGTGLANVYAALQSGISIFDASSGGLGGCPFAPGASGNVATDDLLYMLKQMGYETGIDLQKQIKASLFIQAIMGRRLPSHLLQTN
jgi:hydroxymethylglutaryl-CoA lyase